MISLRPLPLLALALLPVSCQTPVMADCVHNVRYFGAAGDGIADDTAAIQSAIDTLIPGCTVLIPGGNYRITATLTLGDGSSSSQSSINSVAIEGDGTGSQEAEGHVTGSTRLQWHGPAGGTMLAVRGPIAGVRLEGFTFDGWEGPNAAATALRVTHAWNSTFRNLSIRWFSSVGIDLDAYPNPSGVAIGGNGNLWEMIRIFTGPKTPNVTGLRIGRSSIGPPPHLDIAGNQFIQTSVQLVADHSRGIDLRFTDNLVFTGGGVLAVGTGSSALHISPPPDATGFPNAVWFYNTPLQGGVTGGEGWTGNAPVFFWPYPVGDGQPIPLLDATAGITTTGQLFGRAMSLTRSGGRLR